MILKNVVLLIKAANANSNFALGFEELLQEHDYKLQNLQALDFSFHNLNVLKEKLDTPDKYDGILFSSPRCVQATKLALGDENLHRQWLAKNNYTVGLTTYKAAEDNLSIKCLGKETGNANYLADLITNEDTGNNTRNLLYPTGSLKGDILLNRLREVNVTLDAIEVYKTISSPNLLHDFKIISNNFEDFAEYVVFFSPSGLQNVLPMLKQLKCDIQEAKFIALGPTTENAMLKENIKVSGTAAKPTPEEILNIIKRINS